MVLEQFARIGIGPGMNVDAQPEPVRQGLSRAAAIGTALLRQQFLSGDWATIVNGWRYPPSQEGRYGDDFLARAADQSLAGIAANDPAESVYLVTFEDVHGAALDPGRRYKLHFTAEGLPPVDAFWSLTAYTAEDLNLVPNTARRYSVGDRTPDLQWDNDGGLTIHLQPESTGQRAVRELVADIGRQPVVRHPAALPAAPRGGGRDLEVPRHPARGLTGTAARAGAPAGRAVTRRDAQWQALRGVRRRPRRRRRPDRSTSCSPRPAARPARATGNRTSTPCRRRAAAR